MIVSKQCVDVESQRTELGRRLDVYLKYEWLLIGNNRRLHIMNVKKNDILTNVANSYTFTPKTQ